MNLTLSTCFYALNTKHSLDNYKEWITNFFNMLTDCNIVLYTDEKSMKYIPITEKENIKIILKDITEFSTYHYKEKWISNHNKNHFVKSDAFLTYRISSSVKGPGIVNNTSAFPPDWTNASIVLDGDVASKLS